MFKYLFITLLLASFGFTALAQQSEPDTAATKTDKHILKKDSGTDKRCRPRLKKEKAFRPDSLHAPHKAVMRSLMIPGWGQLYNHQWWKVPLIYGGLGLLGDVVVFNQHWYKIFLTEALLREKGIVGTTQNNPLLTN